MNHCLLEVEVKNPPKVRYTQDNKTPIAEMEVIFDGLRQDDQPNQIKVVGWGSMAQELQQDISIGQKLILEGRLRMNTVSRQDGSKEKQAEFTLSRMHLIPSSKNPSQANSMSNNTNSNSHNSNTSKINLKKEPPNTSGETSEEVSWNSAPLIPDTDEIPF